MARNGKVTSTRGFITPQERLDLIARARLLERSTCATAYAASAQRITEDRADNPQQIESLGVPHGSGRPAGFVARWR